MSILLVDDSKIIRADPAYNVKRIIMAPTQGTNSQVLDVIGKGVNGYLIKPFEEANIIQTIEALRMR